MLFLLDKDVRTVKWNGIPLHEASSAIVKEETNGDFYLTVRYPITDSGIYQLIKEDMLIKAPTPVLGAQLFRIKKPIENDDSLDITAYHVSDDIMKRSITPVSVVGQGCAMALSQMVQNAKTGLGDFSFTSDIMDSRTFNTTETETLYSVLMDGKHSIVGTWEGELVRDNFALSIKRSRGADRGVVITTHKNLKSYQRTKNSQGVITRIHARSTFKPDGAEDEVTLRVTVDSPLINSYPYINEKEYENNNAETVEDLRKWAEAKFTNEGIDKVSDAIEIEAYELDGQVVHLGDTVNLKSRKHSADLYKKAIAYEFNALTEEYISITFDDKPGVGGSGVSSGLSNAADAILGASATAQDVAIQKAVKNANAAFDAEFDKRAEKIYDGIEQAKADAEEYADKLKTEISQEFDTFDKEFQATKKSQDQQIADILAKAQANTNLATDAKNIGNQAKLDAATALAKALQYKNEAISEASRLDTVERQATETKLATAKSQAISEATKLVETAKSLLNGQISGVSTDLNQTKEAIKLLATRATVDALTGRISSAESTLQVQAGEIASRVKTSDFDQAKQRISTAESSITQLGNRITTEISETVAKIPTEIGGRNYFLNSDVEITSGYRRIEIHPDFAEHVKGKSFVVSIEVEGTNITSSDRNRWGISLSARRGDTNDRSWLEVWETKLGDTPKKRIYQAFKHQADFNDYIANMYIQIGGNAKAGRPKLEISTLPTDWSPAPEDIATVTALHKVSDTVDSHTRTIGAVGTTGSILDNVSRVTQTANGLVQEVSGSGGIKSQVSQLNNSWSIQNLNSSGDILSQANLSSTQFLLEAAKIRLKGKTLADEIQAIDGKFNTLFVSDGTFGKLDATIIGAQAITGGQIKFDQAFFNNFMANEAYLKQLFAKNAFISQVQSVTMSASQISGGVLKALNNAMEIQMNSGQILYYTDQAALKRILSGYPTQFVKFATGTVSGKGNAGVTVIGSNRYGTESTNDGGFVGIRAWNGANIDMIDVVGDTVRLASSAFDSADGWDVITLPNKLEIDAHNVNHRVSSRMKVGDVWLWKNTSTYSSMRDTINLIIDNLQLLHNNKTTLVGYSYTIPPKV